MKAFTLALAATMLAAAGFVARAADAVKATPTVSSMTADKTIKVGSKILPIPPQKAGCYRHHVGSSAWETTPCMSKAAVARIPHPEGNSQLELEQGSAPLTFVQYEINVLQYASELDVHVVPCIKNCPAPTGGANNFTLQLNTNGFKGADGQNYWVQFTHEAGGANEPADGGATATALCIWNINVTTQDYGQTNGNTVCTTVDRNRNPQHGDLAEMLAFAAPPSSQGGKGTLILVAALPWTTGGTDVDGWSVTAPDVYGLVPNWTYAEGAMLGYGAGSQAQFNGACMTTSLTFPVLKSGTKVKIASPSGVQTLETNNLQPQNKPKVSCSTTDNIERCTTSEDAISPDEVNVGPQNVCYPGDTPPSSGTTTTSSNTSGSNGVGSGVIPNQSPGPCPKGLVYNPENGQCRAPLIPDQAPK
jgi:hypothetical protein